MFDKSISHYAINLILVALMLPSTLLNGLFSFGFAAKGATEFLGSMGQEGVVFDKGAFIFFLTAGPLSSISLLALWWLFFKFRTIQMGAIPKPVWLCLLFGVSSMLIMNFVLLSDEAPRFLSAVGIVMLFGLGPFITMCMMLWRIYRNNRSA